MAEERPELISVVITCFNLQRYIGDTLRSVREQRDAGPFEVIVVDDASTDDSATVISGFPEARLIRSPENGGVLRAMVRGVDAARGDLVCLLDGDDLWAPDKLAAVRRTFADRRIAFATHDIDFIDGAGSLLDRTPRCRTVMRATPAADRPGLVRCGIVRVDDHVWLGSAFSFRKGAADWPGFRAWTGAMAAPGDTYQDWPLAFWIATRVGDENMAYHDVVLMRYRIHGENHSGDARSAARAARNFQRAAATMREMAALAARRGLPRRAINRVRVRAELYRANALACAGRRAAAWRHLPVAVRAMGLPGGRHGLARLAVALCLGPDGADRVRRMFHRLKAGSTEVRTPRRRRA